MLIKTCCDCHEQFEVEKSKAWVTRCYPCWSILNEGRSKTKLNNLQSQCDYWRKRAQENENAGTVDKLRGKLEALESENVRLRFDAMLGENTKHLRNQIESLNSEVRLLRMQLIIAQTSGNAGLPGDFKEMTRTLLQLCHPDKHNGSDASNRATQWLLQQRKGARQ